MKLWDNVGDPSYCPTPLPDCLCHVSFSRCLPLSLEIVENRTNVKLYLAPIFVEGRGRPQFLYRKLLAGRTIYGLAKFGRVPFADLRLRSLAMKWNAKFTEGG